MTGEKETEREDEDEEEAGGRREKGCHFYCAQEQLVTLQKIGVAFSQYLDI